MNKVKDGSTREKAMSVSSDNEDVINDNDENNNDEKNKGNDIGTNTETAISVSSDNEDVINDNDENNNDEKKKGNEDTEEDVHSIGTVKHDEPLDDATASIHSIVTVKDKDDDDQVAKKRPTCKQKSTIKSRLPRKAESGGTGIQDPTMTGSTFLETDLPKGEMLVAPCCHKKLESGSSEIKFRSLEVVQGEQRDTFEVPQPKTPTREQRTNDAILQALRQIREGQHNCMHILEKHGNALQSLMDTRSQTGTKAHQEEERQQITPTKSDQVPVASITPVRLGDTSNSLKVSSTKRANQWHPLSGLIAGMSKEELEKGEKGYASAQMVPPAKQGPKTSSTKKVTPSPANKAQTVERIKNELEKGGKGYASAQLVLPAKQGTKRSRKVTPSPANKADTVELKKGGKGYAEAQMGWEKAYGKLHSASETNFESSTREAMPSQTSPAFLFFKGALRLIDKGNAEADNKIPHWDGFSSDSSPTEETQSSAKKYPKRKRLHSK
jgi:hypothetical protein